MYGERDKMAQRQHTTAGWTMGCGYSNTKGTVFIQANHWKNMTIT